MRPDGSAAETSEGPHSFLAERLLMTDEGSSTHGNESHGGSVGRSHDLVAAHDGPSSVTPLICRGFQPPCGWLRWGSEGAPSTVASIAQRRAHESPLTWMHRTQLAQTHATPAGQPSGVYERGERPRSFGSRPASRPAVEGPSRCAGGAKPCDPGAHERPRPGSNAAPASREGRSGTALGFPREGVA